MLDNFRNNMRGIATVIVIFIGGIFAFSGTGSLFLSGAGAETELVVNCCLSCEVHCGPDPIEAT